jgi:hypothetical protein
MGFDFDHGKGENEEKGHQELARRAKAKLDAA